MRAITSLGGVVLACLVGGASSSASAAQADITVATVSDALNGETSTVAGLVANPGPDGISLREAIEATNNDPGTWTIRFAQPLRGKAILVEDQLPALAGGGVTIEGAGVTLRTSVRREDFTGIGISSSGNRVRALTLDGFNVGVRIEPAKPGGGLPIRQTLAGNVVSGLVMRRIGTFGVVLHSPWSPRCGVPKPNRCLAYDRWTGTTISDNTIESGNTGIGAKIYNVGDRVDHVTVTGNRITVITGDDAGIGFETGSDATGAHISNVLVDRNTIEGEVDIGISVYSGAQRAQANVIENVRVLDNRVHLVQRQRPFCCQGIVVQAGSDGPQAIFPSARPLRYPDGNVTRNVLVRGNTIGGTIAWGVSVGAGNGAGGSRNRVESVRVERNTIAAAAGATGVLLWAGYAGGEPPYRNRIATGNRISRVTIAANRIVLRGGGSSRSASPLPGGIALLSGGSWGRGNSVGCVRLLGNRITGAGPPTAVKGFPGNRATLAC